MKLCAFFLLASLTARCQVFSFGVKAGLSLTKPLAAAPGYAATSPRYTFGPTAEFNLPRHLAFEANLLYKRLRFTVPGGGSETNGRWETPLLLKYRLSGGKLRPFLGAGVSFNRVTGGFKQGLVELRHRGAKGIVLAAGLQTRLGALKASPEIRLTRWADRNFGVSDASLRSSLTQVELLLGVTF